MIKQKNFEVRKTGPGLEETTIINQCCNSMNECVVVFAVL